MPNRFGGSGNPDGLLVPVAGTSKFLAVTTATQDIKTDLGTTDTYLFTANVDAYIKQGAAGATTASAADGSMLVPAGMPVLIDGAEGAEVAVLGLAAGVATLQKMRLIRG